jgi:hypothetical protein
MVQIMVKKTDRNPALKEFMAGEAINVISALKVMGSCDGEKSVFHYSITFATNPLFMSI